MQCGHPSRATNSRRLLVAALAASTAACATNPATGDKELMLVSESQEVELGREYDRELVQSIGLYEDESLQRFVQELGTTLARSSERPDLPWTFRVVNDPTVNAFALPGGFIYITRGILAHLNSEAELASVLGHEIGHVTARHTASQISKQQVAQLGLAIGSLASEDVRRYAGLAAQAVGVLFLKFSRDDEREADKLGLRYMLRGDYDPHEMPDVFRLLERVSEAEEGGRLPEWLATHPSPGNRREEINRQIAALPDEPAGVGGGGGGEGGGGMKIGREAYERRLDGLVYGPDPREGYFKEQEFFHPALRFRMTFPDGWKMLNGKQSVVGISAESDAVVELALAAEESAESAARAFLSQQGISAGPPSRGSLRGMPAVTARFAAATKDGLVHGSVLFVEHVNRVFRIVGHAPGSAWGTYQSRAEAALESFRPLTDQTALSVRPMRLDVLALDRGTTIDERARERPAPVSAEKLALLNQVDVDTPLERGRLVKWVVGEPLP